MPVATRPDRGEATRDALVAAARALFAERGYAAVGTEEVVRRAGVTRGALYHYFRDKQDLFRAVFEQTEAEIMQTIIARVQGGGGHRRAAGFSTSLSETELILFLRQAIAEQLHPHPDGQRAATPA